MERQTAQRTCSDDTETEVEELPETEGRDALLDTIDELIDDLDEVLEDAKQINDRGWRELADAQEDLADAELERMLEDTQRLHDLGLYAPSDTRQILDPTCPMCGQCPGLPECLAEFYGTELPAESCND